ncbi:MAG: DUF58 domain-containing protein [Planctomycetota bacterium]
MTESPSRAYTIIAACCGILAIGMIAGAGLWMTAAITVATVVILGQYVSMVWSSSVVAVRDVATGQRATEAVGTSDDIEVAIGARVPMKVAVTNEGSIPIAWLLAEDLIPSATSVQRGALKIEGARLAVMMLMPGQTRHVDYTIVCRRRGYFQIGPTVLETGDPVGMFRRYRLGTSPMYLTVLPSVELLSTYEIGSRRPIGEIRMRDNVMADPTRLRGIRQWQVGDPMRSVHWAATARTGTLHSKVYEPSSIIGATLLLDFHGANNPSHHEPVRTDLAVTAAASIAAALHDAGEPFGLASNARDAADRIRTQGFQGDHRVRDSAGAAGAMQGSSDRMRPVLVPVDRGPVQLRHVTQTLARMERTDGMTLAEFLMECQSRLSQETTILMIIQSASEADVASILALARRGWAVSVIINTLEIHDYARLAGPLIAERIQVSHLADESSIMDVCRAQLAR